MRPHSLSSGDSTQELVVPLQFIDSPSWKFDQANADVRACINVHVRVRVSGEDLKKFV